MNTIDVDFNWADKNPTTYNFKEFCKEACFNSNLFKDFKQNRVFCEIIGNDKRPKALADVWYNNIKDKYAKLFPKFLENDMYGSPDLYGYDGRYISPGTLYFINILDSIISHFGDIKEMEITEIGSGYGGQCKIIRDYGCKSYTCMDIPETLGFCEKYLGLLDIPAFFTEPKPYVGDLCISNWCLSEFSVQGIDWYVENVVKNHKCCYILSNAWDGRRAFLINKLSEYFKVEVSPEEPKTHPNNNQLIVGKK